MITPGTITATTTATNTTATNNSLMAHHYHQRALSEEFIFDPLADIYIDPRSGHQYAGVNVRRGQLVWQLLGESGVEVGVMSAAPMTTNPNQAPDKPRQNKNLLLLK